MKAKMEVKLKLRQEDLFKKIRVLERKSLEGNNLLSVEPSSNDRSGYVELKNKLTIIKKILPTFY